MTVIADSHAFLWWQFDDPQLTKAARKAIADADVVYISLASVWELAVKIGIGKLEHARALIANVDHVLNGDPFTLLPISLPDAVGVSSLPGHHGDPFDRLLIAQSLSVGAPIVSKDKKFDAYGVSRVW
jgi:PIN domain nuclease of toxin-antitoxin system